MIDPLYIDGFPGGINQSLTPKDIENHELANAYNMELNKDSTLRKRYGVSKVVAGGGPFASRVTSIYEFVGADGSRTVIYSDKTNLWRHAPADPESSSAMTAIDGSVTVKGSEYWEWVVMDGALIGVNGTDGSGAYDNPVIMTSTSGSLVNTANDGDGWSGSVPSSPEHVAVWNRRLWFSEGNVLYGSALGDRTDFSSTGGAGIVTETVGEDEVEPIVGIVPFYDRLIIFKKARIYQLIAGSPNVDANQYEIRALSHKVGCVAVNTVQEVMQDLFFLSYYGVMSLQAVTQYGDFKQARVSKNIPALQSLVFSGAHLSSVVRPDTNQYWVCVPSSAASDRNTDVWVMDFQNIGQGGLPWMRFDGGVCGGAHELVRVGNKQRVYIGGYDDAYVLDEDRWDDDVVAPYTPTNAKFKTKSFDFGEPMRRKEFLRFGAQISAITDPVEFDVTWELDDNPARQKTVSVSFAADITGYTLWNAPLTEGEFILDDATYGMLAESAPDDSDMVWPIRGAAGRRGQTMSFEFEMTTDTQSMEVRRLMAQVNVLPSLFGVKDHSFS